jgi:hypothetical protein
MLVPSYFNKAWLLPAWHHAGANSQVTNAWFCLPGSPGFDSGVSHMECRICWKVGREGERVGLVSESVL